MKEISGLNELESARLKDTAATLGTFDGVHMGHKQIIAKVLEVAREKHLQSTLITFDPHPQMVLGKKGPIEILTTLQEKLELLKLTGIENIIVIEFNRQLASYPPEDFVREILLSKVGMKALVVGHDHAFGRNRSGNKALLKDLSGKMEFYFTAVEAYKIDGKIVNSTLIRNELSHGSYRDAVKYLGYNYSLSGKIVKGHGMGKQLGYPTINLALPHGKLLPQKGVYAANAIISGNKMPGMAYVGERLTFGDATISVEINIFDWNNRLQAACADVELLDFIRPPERFESAEKLIEKMKKDEYEIKKRFQIQEELN